MKVQIQLVGEDLDITDIQQSLRTSEWQIRKGTDGYYLESKLLDCLIDNNDIESKGAQFLDIVNGACNIFFEDHNKIKLGSITKIDEAGKRQIYISITESIRARSRLYGDLRDSQDTTVHPMTIDNWLVKAEKYKSVRDVLHFFNEATWWNLYKVYEVINDDIGGQNNLYKLIPKDEIKLFTHVAQSRELLGDDARHTSQKGFHPPVSVPKKQTV